jgi:uncharacterized protein (DUF2141 family)
MIFALILSAMKALFTKISFLLALILSVCPARAQITNFSFGGIKAQGSLSPSSRIGKSSTDKEHIINIEDCRIYVGETITISWSLTTLPAGDLKYVVKMSLPGGSCGTGDLTTLGDQCHDSFLVSEKALTSTTQNEFDVNLSLLMDVSKESDCDRGDSKVTNIYIVLSDGTKISYQTIQFDIDLMAPYSPSISKITEGDSNLTVSFDDELNTEHDLKYKIYYSTSEFDDSGKSAAESTDTFTAKSYQVTGLENDVLYYIGVSAVDDNDNEGILSTVEPAMPVQVVDFFEHYKESGGREMGTFCFIATAAYGSPFETHVALLRHFRDRVLLASSAGKYLVKKYYEFSPEIADFIRGNAVLRFITRVLLVPVIFIADFTLNVSLFFKIMIVFIFALTASYIKYSVWKPKTQV